MSPTRPDRTSSHPAPHRPGERLRCTSCGRTATNPVDRAELATDWLVNTETGPQRYRFCRDCVPAGPITDLTCIRCSDGPLLAGDLAQQCAAEPTDSPAALLPPTTRGWLTGTGWQLTGPICPDCVHDLRRRASSGPAGQQTRPRRATRHRPRAEALQAELDLTRDQLEATDTGPSYSSSVSSPSPRTAPATGTARSELHPNHLTTEEPL